MIHSFSRDRDHTIFHPAFVSFEKGYRVVDPVRYRRAVAFREKQEPLSGRRNSARIEVRSGQTEASRIRKLYSGKPNVRFDEGEMVRDTTNHSSH